MNPAGVVQIWNPDAQDYITHDPGIRPTPDDNHASGGDNELFDAARDTERPNNPIVTFGQPEDDSIDETSPKLGASSNCLYCNSPLIPHPNGRWAICPNCEPGQVQPGKPVIDMRGAPSRPGPREGANSLLDNDADSESVDPHLHQDIHHPPDDEFNQVMTECPNCGTPTAETQCPRCGQEIGDKTWRYRDHAAPTDPFWDNVPKGDIGQRYDNMVPWASGGTSHYVHSDTAPERDEMTDIYDPINRMTIGHDDGVKLGECPDCGNALVKRASEGFEFCPDCGHRNKVTDTVISMVKEAPGKEHMKGVSPKRNRQYEHIKEQLLESGKSEEEAKEEAARTVNKQRAEKGETKEGANPAAAAREQKEAHPEKYCSNSKCLYRTPNEFCPKHGGPPKEAGFLDEVENIPGDVGQLGSDAYNNDLGGVGGDLLGLGGDVTKGLAYGAKDHPLLAASLAAAPFAVPLGAGALAAAPLIGEAGLAGEGGLAAGLAGDAVAGGLRGGLANYGALLGRAGIGGAERAGVGGAARAMPGRVMTMMKGALGPGAAFSAGRMMSGGGGVAPQGGTMNSMPGTDMAATKPVQRIFGNVLTPDEVAERRAWSQNYDLFSHLAADDDQSSDLSTKNDGDNITDPMTQGSQEETGDSLDELLKSLGDDGSANVDSYSPEQNAALASFNDNLPTIMAFGMHDGPGKGHPVLEAVKSMLEKAFGHSIDGDGGESDDGDDDKHALHPPHIHPESKTSAMPVTTPPAGAMQPQTQQSVTPCAICGGPHQTDQHPSAVSPPAQGGQFGQMTGSQLVEHIAARRPKMCPFHGDLVDYSLTVGDPVSARTAVRPSDYGANYCQSGEYEPKCNFKPGMVTQAYWDDREQARKNRAEQRQQVVPEGVTIEFEDTPAVEPVADEGPKTDDPVFEGDSAVGVGTVSDPAGEALQMAAKILREAGVKVPKGHKLEISIEKTAADEEDYTDPDTYGDKCPQCGTMNAPGSAKCDHCGARLSKTAGLIQQLGVKPGERYLMHANKYDVPDDVTVTEVKPNAITVVYHFPGGLDSAPQELTEDKLREHAIMHFEPQGHSDQPSVSEEFENKAAQPDTAPDMGEVTDLSQVHDGAEAPVAEAPVEDGFEMAAAYDEDDMDGRYFLDDDGDPVDYQSYAASMKNRAPADMQWLWDDVNRGNEVSARQREMDAVLAGRQFSMREQADFITEPGTARNHDKLDLSGTHYEMGSGDDVPDDHLWLGL